MFVPVAFMMQSLPKINTQEDLIHVLDTFVLPQYPDLMTKNPGFTKAECYGVVLSVMKAGKLHIRFKPVEVEKAVDAFLEDRLWVDRETLAGIELLPDQTPYGFMLKPSFLRMFWVMLQETYYFLFRLYALVKLATQHHYYYFQSERKFKIPKSPAHPDRMATLPTRKDS